MKPIEKFRHVVNCSLHDPSTRWARIVNGFLVFLIVFSVAVIPVHFLPDIEWAYDKLFFFDRLTVSIFTIEYVLRIWSAKYPSKYVFSWWGIIDLAAILPFYLARFGLFGTPEIFLFLRMLRILKLSKIYDMEHAAIDRCQGGSHGEFRTIPGERIERIVQKHPLVFFLSLFLPLFFTVIGLTILVFFRATPIATSISIVIFLFGFIFFIKAWLDYNYDVIYITNRRVVLQNRELFGSKGNDVAYESITNVIPENMGFFRWIIGFGNIQIETASVTDIYFTHATKPHEIVRHISENRQRILMAKEKFEGEGERTAERKIEEDHIKAMVEKNRKEKEESQALDDN